MRNKSVLAMYDVRGKQEYIYRSSKIKEIIGASAIIRDVFRDYLYPAARTVRNQVLDMGDADSIYSYKNGEPFSVKKFEEHMGSGQYIGEVVYEGGGNFQVLYKDKETCVAVNRIFTGELMKKTYSLKVLCSFIEDPDFDNYLEDRSRLYARNREHEARESVIYPVSSLPIVQVDPQTSRPLAVTYRTTKASGTIPEKLSLERYAKYKKYEEEERGNRDGGERILDNMVTEKGEESLLAVIYIDGNNMGQKVQECLKGKVSYEECVTELRTFSEDIQKNYVDDRLRDIKDRINKKYKDRRRIIVSAGDEMTFICNARDALDVVEAYFEGLEGAPGEGSSCAGIAIFHSHAPYADAYRLAEECCESGKDRMKKDKLSKAYFLDFHYCQGGMGIALENIRKSELEGGECSRPWLWGKPKEDNGRFCYTLDMVKDMAGILQKIGRTNVKSLLEAARYSQTGLEMELQRINAHRSEKLDFADLGGTRLTPEQVRKLIYDMVLVYDLWFRGEGDEIDE